MHNLIDGKKTVETWNQHMLIYTITGHIYYTGCQTGLIMSTSSTKNKTQNAKITDPRD